MKRVVLFLSIVLGQQNFLYAQEQSQNYFIFGINFLMPYTRGQVSGPSQIVVGDMSFSYIRNGLNSLSSRGLFGLSMGAYIADLRTAFTASGTWVQIGSPGFGNCTEIELSGRYSILIWNPLTFSAIACLRRTMGGSRYERAYGGYFMRDGYWMPGLGIGLDLSVIHADARLHAWPHLRIGNAAVATGAPPSEYNMIPYTLEPVYARYDVSLNLGIEFPIRSR